MTEAKPSRGDILALDRTRMAAERTLMAWLRTSLAMISFGFTIYKFLQVIQQQYPERVLRPEAPRDLGVTLIGLGTFALIIACIQHWKYVRSLRPDRPYRPWDLSFVVSCCIASIGLIMLLGIFVRTGPFR